MGKLEKLDELKQTAALLASGVLPAQSIGLLGTYNPGTIREMEHDLIIRALVKHNGNKEVAARELGISRRTIYRRVEKIRTELGIEKKSEAGQSGQNEVTS